MRQGRSQPSGRLCLAVALLAGQAATPLLVAQADAAAMQELPALELKPLRGARGDVAALLLGGGDSGALRVAPLAVADCTASAAQFWVEIEARSLLDSIGSVGETTESIRLELYVYAVTRDGSIAANLAEWVRIDLADLERLLPGGGLKLVERVELEPGEYQLRLLVREPRSQSFALRVVGLEVPAVPSGESPAELFLAPPLLAERSDRWLDVRPHGWGDAPFPPHSVSAALPVLAAGSSHEIALRGCGLEGAHFAVGVADGRGGDLDEVAGSFDAPPSTGGGAGGSVPGRIDLPALPSGLYRLEVLASRGGLEVRSSQPVFVLAAADAVAGNATPVWTALGEGADRTTGGPADDAVVVTEGDAPDAIAEAYRAVLQRLAQGQRNEALTGLVELQASVAGESDKPQRTVRRLDDALNRVTRQLLAHDPETLLPVLVLHLELQDHYAATERPDPYLLQATRTRIRALAQVYAEEADTELARELAALSLIELAEALERASRRISALEVLREALTLDPANPDVLLHLAFYFESHGLDDDARRVLERLLEIEPRSDEGRLRLAMIHARANQTAQSTQLLERVVRDASTDWVLAVAYEELGQELLREERFAAAVRLLRGAVGRLPQVQRLHLELAYALERNGEKAAAREVLAALPRGGATPSPRLLYRVPVDRETGSRDALLRHATGRLPLLQLALASSAASSGGARR